MASMSEVARRAGVSISTVSHVVNGTRFVSEDKQRRVLDAVAELGYTPNILARSLVTSKTNTLGLAISAFSNVYTAGLCSALERRAARDDFTLLITETHDDEHRELAMVKSLQQRRVDGIFLATSARGDGRSSRSLDYLATIGLPTVQIDRLASDGFDAVGVENVESTAHLTTHLAGKGHRRIALIAGLPGIRTSVERLQGYRLGLERAALGYDPAIVASGRSRSDAAEHAVRMVLAVDDPPTAMISTNNAMTIGVLRALDRRGIGVPGAMALAAFDDFEWADVVRPRLTAMAQPIREIGDLSVDLMRQRLANPGLAPRHHRLAPTFVDRESCGCASARP